MYIIIRVCLRLCSYTNIDDIHIGSDRNSNTDWHQIVLLLKIVFSFSFSDYSSGNWFYLHLDGRQLIIFYVAWNSSNDALKMATQA